MALVDDDRVQKTVGKYWLGRTKSVIDNNLVNVANHYKKNILRKLIPKTRNFLEDAELGDEFITELKRDGEYNLLDFDVDRDVKSIFCNAPNARGRYGLPANNELEQLLADTDGLSSISKILEDWDISFSGDQIHSLRLAGELWAKVDKKEGDRRSYSSDFLRISYNPSDFKELDKIIYSIFDLISINGKDLLDVPINVRLKCIEVLVPLSLEHIEIIPFKRCKEKDQAIEFYESWVIQENHEGVVIYTPYGVNYKIKPKKDIDAVVIGFSMLLDQSNMVGSLLTSLLVDEGKYQVLTGVGSGFSDNDRQELYAILNDLSVESEYVHLTRDGRRFKMVKPEIVIEFSYIDFIKEKSDGGPIYRKILEYNNDRWIEKKIEPLGSILGPVFKRKRPDKSVTPGDLRIEQLGDPAKAVFQIKTESRNISRRKDSQIDVLLRLVFQGKHGGAKLVQKYMVWKNQYSTDEGESIDEYIAYHVNYSFNRKVPLKTKIAINSDLQHAIYTLGLMASHKQYGIISQSTKQIKKGWDITAEYVVDFLRAKTEHIISDGEYKPFLDIIT